MFRKFLSKMFSSLSDSPSAEKKRKDASYRRNNNLGVFLNEI